MQWTAAAAKSLVGSDSVWPHRWQPTRLHRPWDSPGKNTGVSCHFLLQCMKVKSESEVAQSCPTLCNPMFCSKPGFTVSQSLGACSNSCQLSQGCRPTISSSATPLSSWPQSFPASESFPVSRLFTSGGQSTGPSASASVPVGFKYLILECVSSPNTHCYI